MSPAAPKPKPPLRDREYLRWLKWAPCAVHGSRCLSFTRDAAHTDGGGAMGRKGSDALAVSLCHALHVEAHTGGERTFEAKYDVNLRELALEYRARYELGVLEGRTYRVEPLTVVTGAGHVASSRVATGAQGDGCE